ncbi:unnamed protein product, partial [Meganyctiphanes norvegica]
TSMTSSTLHRVFHHVDNGHKIVCVISHSTFDEPDVTFIPISVYFSPVQKQMHTFYPIELNSDYEVTLSFSAHPQPTALMWSFGPNFQEMGNHIQIPFNNGKFSTSLIIRENDNYQALLGLAEITNEDIETQFNLHVANEMGASDYSVMLTEAKNPIECKKGFFMVDGSTQCFKLYDGEIRDWKDAQTKCHEENLLLAEPTDEVAANLRKYIFVKNGDGGVWLNAQGNGEKLVWQKYGTEISFMNRLWWPTLPGKWYNTTHCLLLLSYRSNYNSHPNKPYITFPCYTSHRTLCEDPGNLQFNPKDVFVSPNEKVQLYCGIGGNYSYCIWEKDTNII